MVQLQKTHLTHTQQNSILKKLIAISFLFLLAGFSTEILRAETPAERSERKHEIRIGWGDQMFESVIWHNPQYIINNMPETSTYTYKERYRYTQHLFAEYQYRFNKWFGLGGTLDVSACLWDKTHRNGKGDLVDVAKNQNFINIVLMPTVRFSYCNKPHFNMYSGLGVGLDINTGTELDGYGRRTAYAPAFNLTVVGASFNYQQWFASVELGAMAALRGMDYVYMLGSRLVSVSVGMRF